jgi:hypothetical protein
MTTTPPQAIYERLLKAAKRLGPFTEDPKKTPIHVASRTESVAQSRDGALLVVSWRTPPAAVLI